MGLLTNWDDSPSREYLYVAKSFLHGAFGIAITGSMALVFI